MFTDYKNTGNRKTTEANKTRLWSIFFQLKLTLNFHIIFMHCCPCNILHAICMHVSCLRVHKRRCLFGGLALSTLSSCFREWLDFRFLGCCLGCRGLLMNGPEVRMWHRRDFLLLGWVKEEVYCYSLLQTIRTNTRTGGSNQWICFHHLKRIFEKVSGRHFRTTPEPGRKMWSTLWLSVRVNLQFELATVKRTLTFSIHFFWNKWNLQFEPAFLKFFK